MCTSQSPEFVETYSELMISVTVSGLTILLRVLENLISEKSLGICLKEENCQCLFWQI